MSFKLIPNQCTEDSEDTRKENPQIKYVKMYHWDYVQELIDQIKDIGECLHGAINDSKNRGTERACIPVIKKAYKTVEDFKK